MKLKERFKAMSLRRKIVVSLLVVLIYISIGHVFNYFVRYGKYYPQSFAAKVISPISTEYKQSPFRADTPKVNLKVVAEYGGFRNFLQKTNRWMGVIFWPFLLMVFWGLAVITWLLVGIKLLILAIWWVVRGGWIY